VSVVINAFLDSVFGFLLAWPPLLAISVVSLVVSLIIVGAYKLLTDQKEMKRLKDELKEMQKKMKSLKDDPEKMMKVQREAMALNMQYMSKSMKPTLVTFLPIILVFGWMNAHFAFEPLLPNQEFLLTAEVKGAENVSVVVPEGLSVVSGMSVAPKEGIAEFRLKGEEGRHLVTLQGGGEEVDKEVLITTDRAYAEVSQAYKGNVFERVSLGNEKLLVFWKLGWLGTYIILAIVLSTVLRKLFKVY